jgi:hypothetical protein
LTRYRSMDRDMLLQHLAQAEAHVAQGREHIEKQRRVISDLTSQGVDTTSADELLAQLEETQILHEAGRDRILKELGVDQGASQQE